MAEGGFPWGQIIGAGISAAGTFLAARGQDDSNRVGRPGTAFAAQDRVFSEAGGELARQQAARQQPVALPQIDLSGTGLGQQVNIPGLDFSIGLSPGILGIGTQDFFAQGNAQRAELNDQFPPGAGGVAMPRVAVNPGGTGGAASAAVVSGDVGRRMGQTPPSPQGTATPPPDDIGTDRDARQREANVDVSSTVTRSNARQEQTLDSIGEAIKALLEQTDSRAALGDPLGPSGVRRT